MSRTRRFNVWRAAGLSKNPLYVADGSSDHVRIRNRKLEIVEDYKVKERRKKKDASRSMKAEVLETIYGSNFYTPTKNWFEETEYMTDMDNLDADASYSELQYIHSTQNTDLTYSEWLHQYLNDRKSSSLQLPEIVEL